MNIYISATQWKGTYKGAYSHQKERSYIYIDMDSYVRDMSGEISKLQNSIIIWSCFVNNNNMEDCSLK